MEREILLNSVDEFVKVIKDKDISKIAFAEVNEHRPYQVKDEKLELVKLKKVDLLSYKDSVIYKCVVENCDLDELYNDLLSKGFEVNRKSRNLI